MGKSILIVGDEGSVAASWRRQLSRRGYQVSASTWADSARMAEELAPDLIVVDVALPAEACVPHCHALREVGEAPVLLLADQDAVAEEAGLHVASRPERFASFLAAIEGALEAVDTWLPEASGVLRVGELTLDVEKRLLLKGQDAHSLPPKQFNLLYMLMANPGQILSRKQLMRAIWETDYLGDTRTLYVHIRWLRVKIEDDPNAPTYIRTIRGVGYRFNAPESD